MNKEKFMETYYNMFFIKK